MEQEDFQPVARRDRILLAEGRDDTLLIQAIYRQEYLEGAVQILCYGGRDKLRRFLDTLVRGDGFQRVARIGLSRDSDNGASEALQSLTDAWAEAEATLGRLGLRVPVPSFFALPNNRDTGRVEDLCLTSPSFPGVLDCAREMHQCAKRAATYPIDEQKSIVGAYLSVMPTSGGRGGRLQLGTGALAGAWDLRSKDFAPFRGFVLSVARG